jgi:tRNA pseudouridine55 synthase
MSADPGHAASRPHPHGWLILDKPRGLGSTQAVAAVKRVLRKAGYGKVKIGHGGTLDPLAEGVLPIALGEATKLAGRMLDASKTYVFTVQFGEETDTLDMEGQVVAACDRRPPVAAVAAILERFSGEIEQVPPAYSALKVDGRRAYDLARAGEEVDLKSRRVVIHELELESANSAAGIATAIASAGPFGVLNLAEKATLIARVSKGTYIRSLARDIAHALGTVGHVAYLRRRQAGPFTETHAISLDTLEEIGNGARLEDHLLPLEAGLDGIPALTLDPESAQAARQGRVLSGMLEPDGLYLATAGNVPVALMELQGGTAKVVRGFNLTDTAE